MIADDGTQAGSAISAAPVAAAGPTGAGQAGAAAPAGHAGAAAPAGHAGSPGAKRSVRRLFAGAAVSFGKFWWDFLVGDTPGVTLATAVVIGVVALLVHTVSATVAWVVMPVAVAAILTATVTRAAQGARRARHPQPAADR
ncbi:MAG TPA: hypothetical protein VG184_00645 [Acidimicrobiales bacterium]|nr:hypothetical protein [Acidimicrobiales bacterium]